ncbi:hypothetical protein P0082_08555 [Candidatus Haliotispira prima]|uniref:Uncharacterized protein n=1 Tax=Candidatus Haliotispira prima TaxID=3034016 RepID=A0ABY8MH93_9SPIO|nr:hypothetical protein P0082_08555 [Candidatus Haliotispira prima]
MTDVKSDSGAEAKFNVRASTEFVGATQALVSLTPTKSGAAAFLTIADTETIPSATAAEVLLAYREIDFSGTSAQIIQFALSISATQNAISGDVSGGTGAVLQPSTAYKIVMYSNGNSTTLLSFTTLGNIGEGYPFIPGRVELSFDMSAHNFETGTDGKLQVPFVFSWLVDAGPFVEVSNNNKSNVLTTILTATPGANTVRSEYTNLLNKFGDSARGGAFLHTPRSGAIRKYSIALTNLAGLSLPILYNQE